MKISAYTIALNEEKFAEGFAKALQNEVDEIVVLDTGSTDKTVEALRDNGVRVHEGIISPWRFDVARNINLSHVSPDTDVCVCVDLDERFEPGLRKGIEAAWQPGVNSIRYQYAWSHKPDNTPALTFWYEKIHARSGFRWVKPVHEVLACNTEKVFASSDTIFLHHWPDASKSRSSYLPLLELAVKEEPDDDRSSHYLGREYTFYGMHNEAIAELQRHLSLQASTWKPERAASMRMIAKAYNQTRKPEDAISWMMRACNEAPGEREPWVDLAFMAYERQYWGMCYGAAKQALTIETKPSTYMCEPDAWGEKPHDLASIAAWNLGMIDEALMHAKLAAAINPTDARLQGNVELLTKISSARQKR